MLAVRVAAEQGCQKEGQGGCSGTNGLRTGAQSSPSMCKSGLLPCAGCGSGGAWAEKRLQTVLAKGRSGLENGETKRKWKSWVPHGGKSEERAAFERERGGACMQDREAESRGWGCWRQI